MVEKIESKQVLNSTETFDVSESRSLEAFREELAQHHAVFLKVKDSNDGFPCQIYKTKSDCDWHPPCGWSGAGCD